MLFPSWMLNNNQSCTLNEGAGFVFYNICTNYLRSIHYAKYNLYYCFGNVIDSDEKKFKFSFNENCFVQSNRIPNVVSNGVYTRSCPQFLTSYHVFLLLYI